MQIASQLSHSQVQTLLAAIGFCKGNDIWVPTNDRLKLDASLATSLSLNRDLPPAASDIAAVLGEVDVIWIRRGSGDLAALFEVEHSTPVYSGLLRFNDFHLVMPTMRPRFSVVSNDNRRALFVRQVNRPTFKASGLSDLCTFLEYANVYDWWRRVTGGAPPPIKT
jgi:type II restriction enzyme